MKSLAKKVLIFVTVMAILACAGWFGRKAYKKSEEHRLLEQADQLVEKQDWRNASLCLQRALQVNPMSVAASKSMANMLEAAGSPTALTWRIRAAKLEPDNFTNYLLWAKTAIQVQDFKSAKEALATVEEKKRNTADYQKIAGALAWNLGQAEAAESHYVEALRLEPANQANVLNLETIRLTSTNPMIAQSAGLALEQRVTNAALRPAALQHLLTAAVARHDLSKAIDYSSELIAGPAAGFADKLNHLQLLREAKRSDFTSWLTTVQNTAAQTPANAFALGRWLATAYNPDTALRWLHSLPSDMQTNQPVPLILTDCQIALKDWNGLLTITSKQDWGAAEFYRLAVESLARRGRGETVAAEADWRKAVRRAAKRLDGLSQLAQVTAAWGWKPERTEVLRQITEEFPNEKWAVNELLTQYYADGNTLALSELLLRSHAADPADAHLKNNLANILLLRKSQLEQANIMAKEAYETAAGNPFFVSTYAYSLFLQKKNGEALKVLATLTPEQLKIPSIAAYYGVIQAESGHQDLARDSLARAESAPLLPEEKEMVRLVKARL